MSRLQRAALVRLMDDELWCFVCHVRCVALSCRKQQKMSLVRKTYFDSRTCSGDPADFTATLPEPIRADPSLGIILSQLTFVNNFNTVMAGYSDRLYFGVNVPDVSGVVTANVNDRVYPRVIDSTDAEAGAVGRIFVIPPATYTLATLRTALQTALRTLSLIHI